MPPVRCIFFDVSKTCFVQLQLDRLTLNWRLSDAKPYPGYDAQRVAFADLWSSFYRFLESEDFDEPEIQQCEVSYVNFIERQEQSDLIADLSEDFPILVSRAAEALEPSIPAASNAAFALPNKRGQLQIMVQPGIRQTDGAQVLQLSFTTRSRPLSAEQADVLAELDTAHDWDVQAFMACTSESLHRAWGRRS